MKKRILSIVARKNIGLAKTGNKHPLWKGGVSSYRDSTMGTVEYKQWRKAVFERDKYTCLICGQVGGQINAHHVASWKDYPLLRFDVNNGITLCIKCHYLEHRKGEKS